MLRLQLLLPVLDFENVKLERNEGGENQSRNLILSSYDSVYRNRPQKDYYFRPPC
jgi:hypothetical protein